MSSIDLWTLLIILASDSLCFTRRSTSRCRDDNLSLLLSTDDIKLLWTVLSFSRKSSWKVFWCYWLCVIYVSKYLMAHLMYKSTSVFDVEVSGQSGTGSGSGIVLIFWWISTILSWTSLGKTDGLSHGLGGGLGKAPCPVPFVSSFFNPSDICSSFSLIWSKLPWLSSTSVFRHLALEVQVKR